MAKDLDESALVAMVVQVVEGDLHTFEELLRARPAGLGGLEKAGVSFIVSAAAVRRVLLALRRREVPPELTQQWASFVRRGFVGHSADPIMPLDINYDEQSEDPIIEA